MPANCGLFVRGQEISAFARNAWWWMQSGSNRSPSPGFPNNREKYRENRKNGARKYRRHHHQTQHPCGFLAKFLEKNNRERFPHNRELNSKNREYQGMHNRGLAPDRYSSIAWARSHLIAEFAIAPVKTLVKPHCGWPHFDGVARPNASLADAARCTPPLATGLT